MLCGRHDVSATGNVGNFIVFKQLNRSFSLQKNSADMKLIRKVANPVVPCEINETHAAEINNSDLIAKFDR